MNKLFDAYAIDVASYANKSNHTHLVLRADADKVAAWSWQQLVVQWHVIYGGNMLSQCFFREESLSKVEQKVLQRFAET